MSSTPPPPPPAETYTHTGHRFVLGYVGDAYGIWDRTSPGEPIRRYPRTEEGWAQAWREYSAWEPSNAPVGGPPAPASAPASAPAAYGPVATTNGRATAALVCGIIGFLFFPVAIAALILGFIARSEIRRSGGRQGGDGLAVAGIILGFISLTLGILSMAYVLSNIDEITSRFPNGF